MSDYELQARLIYALIVAGKSAKFATAATKRLLENCGPGENPLEMCRRHLFDDFLPVLSVTLQQARTGNYTKLSLALIYISTHPIDLRTCSPQKLEEVPGIGPKTSRFFINWTRPDAQNAVLDVHVLRWMQQYLGSSAHVPKTTPQSESKYREWADTFVRIAEGMNKTVQQLDAEIWTAGSRYSQAELFEELCTTKTNPQTSATESTAG